LCACDKIWNGESACDEGRKRDKRPALWEPQPMIPRHLVGSVKAAEAVSASPASLQRWVKEGRIKPVYVTPGGRYRWDVDELRRQLGISTEGVSMENALTADPIKPQVAAAIVTSELGVLVGKRNDGAPPWTFIAGKIHEGESPADAAVREVKEETGLVVRPAMREIGRRIHPKTQTLMIYIACRPTEGLDVFVGDEEELAEVRWVKLGELGDLMGGAGNVFEPVWQHLSTTLAE
jgi:8-oxo-dGTP pyrophosphatase MutT (NUDIX family)